MNTYKAFHIINPQQINILIHNYIVKLELKQLNGLQTLPTRSFCRCWSHCTESLRETLYSHIYYWRVWSCFHATLRTQCRRFCCKLGEKVSEPHFARRPWVGLICSGVISWFYFKFKKNLDVILYVIKSWWIDRVHLLLLLLVIIALHCITNYFS